MKTKFLFTAILSTLCLLSVIPLEAQNDSPNAVTVKAAPFGLATGNTNTAGIADGPEGAERGASE
ncbi:MAG: hypothetical protein HY880_00980 [Deltaproteobacteria bacterium]|nr:hypothetical protein [Deltaproteobacteria bacterium]